MDSCEIEDNNAVESELKRIFPEYFSKFSLPEGAHEERILVYRACKTNKCDKKSFTPTYEEQGCQVRDCDDPTDPSLYSLSTYEKPRDVKRFAITNSDIREPIKIAMGYTEPSCGLVQRTRERTGRRTSHVDWWLYVDAEPYKYFEIIEDFADYLENYKKGKAGE